MEIKGTVISGGNAEGVIYTGREKPYGTQIKSNFWGNVQKKRYRKARAAAAKRLEEMAALAMQQAGEVGEAIFMAQTLILNDEEFVNEVENLLAGDRMIAEAALRQVTDEYLERFSRLENELLRTKAEDIKEVSALVMEELFVIGGENEEETVPFILATKELNTSRLVSMVSYGLTGLVLEKCPAGAHMALVARAMNIPIIAGVHPSRDWNQKKGILVGSEGKLVIEDEG